MGINVKVKCDGSCRNELNIVCNDICAINRQVNKQCVDNGWLIDSGNNKSYCRFHAPAAANELGLVYEFNKKWCK